MSFSFNYSSKFLVLSLFFLFSSYVSAFNITSILGKNSDFSTFNDALSRTGVANTINSRQTLTVLAVDNGGMSQVSGQPADVVKKVLSLHVILDYYDVQKLQQLPNKTAILTTLFQTGGQATGQEGFLNVTRLGNGQVAFGSAVPGSSLSSNLVNSIASQPYNISVLQVSSVVVPQGLGTSKNSSSPPSSTPVATPKKSPSPVSSPKKSPVPVSSPKKSPSSPTPASSSPADDSSPAGSPPATTPAADSSPVGSPPAPAVANEPTADGAPAGAPAGGKSDAHNRTNHDGALMLCLSIFWGLALTLW